MLAFTKQIMYIWAAKMKNKQYGSHGYDLQYLIVLLG